jgi:hypothetical protein
MRLSRADSLARQNGLMLHLWSPVEVCGMETKGRTAPRLACILLSLDQSGSALLRFPDVM